MKTASVKTYATEHVEAAGVTEITPFDLAAAKDDLLAALSKNFNKPHLIHLERDPSPFVMRRKLDRMMVDNEVVSPLLNGFWDKRKLAEAKRKQKKALRSSFGKYLPQDEQRIIDQAKEGLESIEDRLAAVCYAIDKVKSRKAWKVEQSRHQQPEHYASRQKAKKQVVDGKTQWVDAQIHELPPLTGKGKAHQPAYYAIKLPDGKVVALNQTDGDFSPMLNAYPSHALQAIAKRLGITMRGGDTAILNHLLGAEQIVVEDANGVTTKAYQWLPSYTTVWQGVWVVYVGWRLNPSCSNSSYWLDANGQLTQEDPNKGLGPDHEAYEPPLTLSQLDYHLLCESSDLEVQNEDGETVEFMNEEEEFLTMFPQRESNETFIDFSRYCEDDEEMTLFRACSAAVERSEGGITLGDLESSQFVHDHIHQGLVDAHSTLLRVQQMEPGPLSDQILQALHDKIARLEQLDHLWNKFIGNRYDEAMPDKACFTAKAEFREPLKVLPCMTEMPANEVEAPVAREVEAMPAHRTARVSLADAKQLRRMKQVCASIIHGRFGMLVRQKNAQDAFAEALDSALRA